jgi:hypothetical protein
MHNEIGQKCAPLIDGINTLNIFGLAWVEHKLKEHKMNFKKETPQKTQYMKFFKQVNKQAKTSPLAKGGKKKKK